MIADDDLTRMLTRLKLTAIRDQLANLLDEASRRELTLIDTIAQSVGLMGPVFSIAFLVPLVVGGW